MPSRPSLRAAHEAPEGFRYCPELLTRDGEAALLATAARLEYEPVVLRGVASRRRVAHFGARYRFDAFTLEPTAPLPRFLEGLRARAAGMAGRDDPRELAQALVAWYPPGAGIGWHRDAPAFGPVVVGISLGSPCRLRLRRRVAAPAGARAGGGTAAEAWEIFVQLLEPRSLYVLGGASRARWQHSIPPGKEERYSITFRTVRGRAAARPEPPPDAHAAH